MLFVRVWRFVSALFAVRQTVSIVKVNHLSFAHRSVWR
jgi:hypothetical protein